MGVGYRSAARFTHSEEPGSRCPPRSQVGMLKSTFGAPAFWCHCLIAGRLRACHGGMGVSP